MVSPLHARAETEEAMTNPVRDSHWISHFLLKRWEATPGRLRYYDFTTGRIHPGSAKGTFVSPTPFPEAVEKALGAVIETPLGEYLARSRKAGTGLVGTANEREDHAIVLALMCQSIRTAHANGNSQLHTIESLLTDGAGRIGGFVKVTRASFEFLGANLVSDRLFFPSTGTVALPVTGSHGWMLPVSPAALVACLPKFAFGHPPRSPEDADFPVAEGPREDALKALLANPGLLTTISVGIVGDRVVLPPDIAGTEEEIAQRVRTAREDAKHVNALVARANAIAADVAPRGFPDQPIVERPRTKT
jgi:hypothetical protein